MLRPSLCQQIYEDDNCESTLCGGGREGKGDRFLHVDTLYVTRFRKET
jgi:hypothetical protein